MCFFKGSVFTSYYGLYFSSHLFFFSFQSLYSNCSVIYVICYWYFYPSSQVLGCGETSNQGMEILIIYCLAIKSTYVIWWARIRASMIQSLKKRKFLKKVRFGISVQTKVISDSPGLMDFAVGLVDLKILGNFLWKFNIRCTEEL